MRCKGTTFFGKKNVLAIFLLKKSKKNQYLRFWKQKAEVFILISAK
jgi:hypothetical protein